VKEAKRLGIPVVAIVDSNADPDPIDYVIPGNDDSVRGIQLIVDKVAEVLKDADGEAQKAAAEARAAAEAERAQKAAADKAARKENAARRPARKGAPANRRANAAAAQEVIAAEKAEAEAATAPAAE
jgi:small subunit ribosomal protein S2